MQVTQKIKMDLLHKQNTVIIDVMQGDSNTRILEMSLYSGGVPWKIPEGVSVAIAYRGASGSGIYDTLPNGDSAYTISDNVVTAILIPQVMSVDGDTTVTIVFTDANGKQLATFGVIVRAEPNPEIGAGEPSKYYNLREWVSTALHMNIDREDDGSWSTDKDYDTILQEHRSGREIGCNLEMSDETRLYVPFARWDGETFAFSTVYDGKEWRVEISKGENGETSVQVVSDAYALKEDLEPATTEEKYFGITDDGLIYLKSEYRGAGKETPYSISDNGAEVAGSKNAELPDNIVIPEIVNEIAVISLAEGMFRANNKVKSITIPVCITEIPEYFCYMARGLTTVNGTENVRVIKGNAFCNTAIEKVSFPSLELLDGDKHFYTCGLLISADLGSKITAIPNECMNGCYRLSALRNTQNVTSVGAKAFYRTSRLMAPAFLPKLTSVGDYGFMRCRVVYDWKSLTGCSFGTQATALQTNPTDFWSECAFAPCEIPMRSTFSQRNPAWADATVDNLGTIYRRSCITVCSAMVYSVLEGKDMTSPQEFIDAVRAANPSALDVNSKTIDGQIAYWNALGYTVNRKNFDAENLQLLYNTLAAGTPVIVGVLQPSGGHMVVVHGINEKGEVLVADPESTSYYYGDYRVTTYAIAVQNLTAWGHEFFFPVKK